MQGEVPSDKELYVSVEQACKRLCISRVTLYRIFRTGKLASTKIGGRRVISRGALDRFVRLMDQSGGIPTQQLHGGR